MRRYRGECSYRARACSRPYYYSRAAYVNLARSARTWRLVSHTSARFLPDETRAGTHYLCLQPVPSPCLRRGVREPSAQTLRGLPTGVWGLLGQDIHLLPGGHPHALQHLANRHLLQPRPQRHVEVHPILVDPPHAVLREAPVGYELRDNAVDKPFCQPG
jgi:hypothetical protein